MNLTVTDALRDTTAKLRGAAVPDPARDARALVAFATGFRPDRLLLEADQRLTGAQTDTLFRAVADRMRRRPIAQIVGRRLFWGRSFRVTGDVLDPRPETETIIARALELGPARRLLDLGTGTGALALTLLSEWTSAIAVATDISDAALGVAAQNATGLGVADRVSFVRSDWFAEVEGRFDLIVCNPPYISESEMAGLDRDVGAWEPHIALSPGGDGLDAYRHIASGLAAHLDPGGHCLFEIGRTQAAAVTQILRRAGLQGLKTHTDMSGASRVIEAALAP